jgi:hypothetical protein
MIFAGCILVISKDERSEADPEILEIERASKLDQ